MSAKCQEHYPAEMDEAINAGACPVCLRRELAEAQAKIDRLMLEYCPEEMTEDQMQRWANSQKISPERKP